MTTQRNVLTYWVERRTDIEGRTLFFVIRSSDHRTPSKFFQRHEVPPFEGAAANFEIERKGKVWRFLRRVDG